MQSDAQATGMMGMDMGIGISKMALVSAPPRGVGGGGTGMGMGGYRTFNLKEPLVTQPNQD